MNLDDVQCINRFERDRAAAAKATLFEWQLNADER